MPSSADLLVLALIGLGAVVYLFKDSIFSKKVDTSASKLAQPASFDEEGGDDFVSKLKEQKKRIVIFYGSQTGTAEEYAVKIAKEAKARFGTSSLVLDPEEYEFDKLDALPADAVAIFVMATYGEGEPTDNAVKLVEHVAEESPQFTQGDNLESLKYVIFGLGNRTYEHYNKVARDLDSRLQELGATRVGERGEGDDDKSMEEDYLEWKDGMFEALAQECGFEEGGGGEVEDFEVAEIDDFEEDRVYQGELSARALLGTKGIHDAKNPYPAPIIKAKELFSLSGERSCVHMEFDIDGSGISYQHGDHIAVWPNNPEIEVERILAVLGLTEKRFTVIDVESLDPTLAKVPFPVPTTYDAIFRHYLDISAAAGRQAVNSFAKYAPSEAAKAELAKIGSDKAYFGKKVASRSLKLAEVLQSVAGDDLRAEPSKSTPWQIPFDRIISAIPRVGPRFYSISSSPKLYPKAVHVTAVVLRYQAADGGEYIHGLATNFISTLKQKYNQEQVDARIKSPYYNIEGPRGAYIAGGQIRAPIHIRRSTFRLPTSPKIPVIMVGPGTGVAPFRGFVQERVASAQKAIEKNGPEALKDWGKIRLFYGCRKSNEDFLYKEEWEEHKKALGDTFEMYTALSREKFKPDGSKLYVQDLVWEQREAIAKDILDNKAYIFVCGEAAGMAKDVEATLVRILSEAKGSAEDGKKELQLLKSRSRLLLDVWS
ncbi:cytochrome p450 oxidoreductase [Ceraceosorus bombacis]|uniref:NADPH--cytochrome P450 reductase n=1 Tax=Ceraceosorus bombacis TaxID=401625 RepID=A0A0P1BKQ4_9BASI|nr:cytochrome p450 oxidoreductase [Ceraceosorus bombacis]